MTSHLVVLTGPLDGFKIEAPAQETCTVPFGIPGDPRAIGDSTHEVLARLGLKPPLIAEDVLRLGIAAYTADTHFPRSLAFDRWTRDLRLHLPVSDVGLWSLARDRVTDLLSFLTGDHWEIEFRSLASGYEPTPPEAGVEPLSVDGVCLFSGGLDSFIGAVDALEARARLVLVGHHAKGSGATSSSQNQAIAALRSVYEEQRTPFLRFWVSPPKGPDWVSETSTRGRSLLFLALGLAVAAAAGARTLIVPENGFISLNVPLTNSRLGSLSTRTTHPHFIGLVRAVLLAIGMPIELQLPYRFKTKGEMVQECANPKLLTGSAPATMSCSHPESNRFRAHDPTAHCGRCLPCLIRRAALAALGDNTNYVHENLSIPLVGKSGSDLRAAKLALDRFRQSPPSVAEVLAAGPLPGTDEEREAYLGVFRRGVAELRSFLHRYDKRL